MRCPFLREEQVKSCQAAPFRKSLARSSARADLERCSSADYASCPVARHSHEEHPSPGRCPFLEESLAQFCAATPSPTYVPWSSSPELRCAHAGHRYCDLFLGACGAGGAVRGTARHGEDTRVHLVADVPMPGWLAWSNNHLWLATADDGVCHVGVDAFLVQLVGRVERLAFLTLRGSVRPAVVLTAHGVDLTLVFPAAVSILTANTRLRSSLDRLTADPYGRGWLFEGRWPDSFGPADEGPDAAGLRRGAAARRWMADEVRRVSELLGRLTAARGDRFAADGGRFAPDLLDHLDREEILRLFAETFPITDLRRTP